MLNWRDYISLDLLNIYGIKSQCTFFFSQSAVFWQCMVQEQLEFTRETITFGSKSGPEFPEISLV
jgi:hypothetical protein